MQPSKYSSAPSYQKSGSYYSKDVVGNYNYKSELPRSKQLLDKNAQNPPVSYKPPSKIVSSRSRDPSPVQHNICSRLEPPRIRRSLSKEKTNVPSYIQQNNVKIPRFTDMYRNNDIGNTTKPIKSVSDTYNYKIRPREDENKSSNKYISSRFLPKNAIEKSYSGYSRSHSSLAKANETSRKNRELLKTINVEQERDRRSRSITTSISTSSESSKEPKQHNFIPTKKIESESTSEKEKLKPNPEIDKINTMTKNLKLSTPPSTPWTSILDMKFSKPTGKLAKNSSNPKFPEESPSRGHSCVPEDKKNPKKLLIPQIKNRSNTLFNSLGGQPNKDFRKSVLNMSDMARKKTEAGNNSSSADSVTDVSDNSSKSIRISKLPQKMNFQRNKSCEDNITLKYSMSQTNIKCNEIGKESQSEEKMKWVVGSSSEEDSERISTNCDVSLSYDDSQKDEKCEIPKTLKINHIPSGEIPWWLDEKAEAPEGVQVLYPDYINGNEIRDENGRIVYKLRKNQSGDSSWWNEATDPSESQKSNENLEPEHLELHQIRHIDSGERSWWMSSHENLTDVTEDKQKEKSGDLSWSLGDRASPEGIEMPKSEEKLTLQKQLFISKHKDIDDVLGGSSQILSPLMEKIFFHSGKNEEINEISNQNSIIQGGVENKATFKLDDAALQLYKDGDYGSYLDLDSSISEQQEEFEGFQESKKNSIVLRTQLSVRVHTIIEKLLTCEGRDLRRALFSLKQIFQEDKDLVHEFVQNDGLSCLIKVGSVADQNYQNYILRALGQVMLYVDGMNGVIEHNPTIQWLYSLISSKFRLVVKTALKLLLVFVEYTDSNCMLLVQAVKTVDCSHGLLPWQNVMKLLRDFNSADTELLIYATTLINKVLSGVPDQDCYYDLTDALEEQGIEHIIQRYMSKPGTDLDLLQQFQIYEAVLQYEDGVENSGNLLKLLDESIRKTLRRKSGIVTPERRKSRRHSTGTSNVCNFNSLKNKYNLIGVQPQPTTNEDDNDTSSSQSSEAENLNLNGKYKENIEARSPGVTPALRQRRERVERQRNFLKQQEDTISKYKRTQNNEEFNNNKINVQVTNGSFIKQNPSRRDTILPVSNINIFDTDEGLNKKPWIFNMIYKKKNEELDGEENEPTKTNGDEKSLLLQLKRENTVKDLTQKLASQNILHSPPSEDKISRIGDMSGLISKAKEGLAKSKSKVELLKSPTNELAPKFEIKMSENELRWEEMTLNMNRRLHLCDMDFTDLGSEDEIDIVSSQQVNIGIPPPPPPFQKENTSTPPPPPLNTKLQNPPIAPNFPSSNFCLNSQKKTESKLTLKKNKKTVKLFWKEVRDDVQASSKVKTGNIWEELTTVNVDTQKLEHLFESRAKDLLTKKQQEMNKNKEIIVLDPKRSNAINIGMTKLPPPRSIKAAILKMDATIMNREGIEKLLTMLPTKDERTRIQEAQTANPDIPLGNAEQFLLTLASISELPARLKLWAFKLDFENTEREIAEPLMDLKQGIESLKGNETFKAILSTLLSIGNFLNGAEVKGFQIDYLSKVPEVKDTVHKHSLLHHLCHIVLEKFPHATDLYSEIGALTRASKIDFDELAINKQKLEDDCKASWDHLKLISKHDGSSIIKGKMSDFLTDCAERIILLGIIHRRVMNRFHKFLLWLGIPIHQISDIKPNEFCKIISEFALEYRTTRERVIQQLEKKANHRERNKTRGKMITDLVKFKSKEDRADEELRHLLGSDLSDVESFQGTLPLRRTRKESSKSFLENHNGNLTDGDDELLESLVKTATKGPSRIAPRERKRTRHSDRKSLKRSRTRENSLAENSS